MRRSTFRRLVVVSAAWSAAPLIASAADDGAAPYRPQEIRRPAAVGQSDMGIANPSRGIFSSDASALGGTSGTWVGPNNGFFYGLDFAVTNSNWSTATNWSPSVPNNGGVALIGRPGAIGSVERQGSVNPILNINVALDTIIGENELAVAIGGTTNPIGVAPNGLVIENRAGLAVPFTGSFVFSDGLRIYPQVVGTGSVEVVGSGSNFPRVSQFANPNNTFSGGLFVRNGGVLLVDEVPAGAGEPGVPYTGEGGWGNGTIVLDGGAMWMVSASPSPTVNIVTKPIFLGAGGGTFLTAGAQAVFANEFSGPGNLNLVFPTTKLFTGNNTFTGNLRVGTGKVTLQQGGAMVNAAQATVDGKLELDNQVFPANRLGDNATVQLNSAKLNIIGDPSGDVDEKIGTLAVSGYSTVTAQTQSGFRTSITADNLVRNGKSTVFFRGENVGTAGPEGTRFIFNNPPTQIGGVIPFAIAASYAPGALPGDEVVAAPGQIGLATLTRYDATRGVVPLNLASDYSINTIGSPTDNVKVDTTTTLTGTLNALVMGNTANNNTTNGAVLGGGQLNITSGVILGNSNGAVINNPITTTASELIIHSTSASLGTDAAGNNGLRLSGVISGNISVTKSGHGNVYFYGANTYTGETTLIGGRTVINASVLPNQPGPWGNAPQTTPIRFIAASTGPEGVAGIDVSRLFTVGDITIGRDMILEGTGVGGVQIGAIAPSTLTITGNMIVNVTDDLILSGNVNINGNISGTGNLADVAGLKLRLAGDNSAWSGGFEFNGTATDANPTTVYLASNTGFGTGDIFLSGPSQIRAEGGPRTMTNLLVMDPSDAGVNILDGQLTLTGDVEGASFTRTFIIPSTGDVTFAGSFRNSGYRFAGAGTFASAVVNAGGGTVTLSGNNNHNGRLFVGLGAGGTLNTAVWVRLASDGALGQAGIQMDAPGSVIELVGSPVEGGGINLPNRNIFIRDVGVPGAGSLNDSGSLRSSGGNNTMAGDIILVENSAATSGTGIGAINVVGATTLTLTGQLQDITGAPASGTISAIADGGTIRKIGAGTFVLPRIIDAGGDSADTGTLVVAAPLTRYQALAGTTRISQKANPNTQEGISVVRNLDVNAPNGARLDLTNNSLIVDYSGPTPRAAVEALIQSGYAGGTWAGAGILSSLADDNQFALGVGEVGDTPFSGNYQGVAIDADGVIVRFTRYGDANLDGITNISDFARLGANFNLPGRWATGDFNYDNVVNIGDFSLLAANFNRSVPSDAFARGGAVPEPATLGALALGAAGLTIRRRRA